MFYATQKDLEDAYSKDVVDRLADRDNDGFPDVGTVDESLAGAASIIDAYLGARYSVPVENPPPVLRDLCVDIALYRLASSPLKQTNEMRLRYEDAIKLLTRIGEGKASIGLDTSGEGTSDDQSGRMIARTSFLNRA